MSDRGVVRGTWRRRSISESGYPRLNSTILDSDLVFGENDLINTRNNVTHQSQPIISNNSPGGFIESPMWVGTGDRLQTRKFPANSDQEHIILSKFKTLRDQISEWQYIIEYDLITADSIKADHKRLKGEIHSLYQESIYAHASEKLSYDVIGLISLIDWLKTPRLD